jgi:hypothetical protein
MGAASKNERNCLKNAAHSGAMEPQSRNSTAFVAQFFAPTKLRLEIRRQNEERYQMRMQERPKQSSHQTAALGVLECPAKCRCQSDLAVGRSALVEEQWPWRH